MPESKKKMGVPVAKGGQNLPSPSDFKDQNREKKYKSFVTKCTPDLKTAASNSM